MTMWNTWLYIFSELFLLIVAVREARKPAKAMIWMVIGVILPIVGFVAYLIFANPVRARRDTLVNAHKESVPVPDSFSRTSSIVAQSLRQLTVHGLRKGTVQILTNGIETYKKLIESLQNAKKSIDAEYFLFRDDRIGNLIANVLIERAKSGVRVRFIRDGWGSRKFPQSQIDRMIEAGIEFRTIFPKRFPWVPTSTHRDHCKIVAIDGEEGFTGGINIGYEYTGLKPNIGFWRDTHLRIMGEAVHDLGTLFDAHWKIASPERAGKKLYAKPVRDKGHREARRALPSGKSSFVAAEWGAELGANDSTPNSDALHHAYIQTLENNPGLPTQIVREACFICLTQATRTIDITTLYFLPEADIIMALKTAAARGIRVRLLVPRKASPKIVGPASRTYYGELLEAGVHIYLYEKGVLHAKVMIIDGEIAGVGSPNYDMSSFRLNYEVLNVLYSAGVAQELTEQFERDLKDSTPLQMDELKNRPFPQRVIDQAARLFSPLL